MEPTFTVRFPFDDDGLNVVSLLDEICNGTSDDVKLLKFNGPVLLIAQICAVEFVLFSTTPTLSDAVEP